MAGVVALLILLVLQSYALDAFQDSILFTAQITRSANVVSVVLLVGPALQGLAYLARRMQS